VEGACPAVVKGAPAQAFPRKGRHGGSKRRGEKRPNGFGEGRQNKESPKGLVCENVPDEKGPPRAGQPGKAPGVLSSGKEAGREAANHEGGNVLLLENQQKNTSERFKACLTGAHSSGF